MELRTRLNDLLADGSERWGYLRTVIMATIVGASVAWAVMIVAFAFDPSRLRL